MGISDKVNVLESPQVIVVEASAGSGKTYHLAQRYLQLLINPTLAVKHIPLRNILAITFTNKATIEMKGRILEFLKKIALDDFSSKSEKDDVLALLGVDSKQAQVKANLIMEELIRHYNFFQVQTIDSFINTLLLGCALNIDRSASFKIKRDYSKQLGFCFDLVIDQAAIDSEVFNFFEDFLEHYLFVENRSGWFPKENILVQMQSLFRLSNKYGEIFSTFSGEGKDIIKKKKSIYNWISQLSESFPDKMNARAKKYICSFLEKNDPIFNIASLPAVFTKSKVLMNKGQSASVDFAKKWVRIHKGLQELVELDATVTYNPYIKLFKRLVDFFQLTSKKEDILFLEELNRKARLLFDLEGLTVAEVYYRLATRFRHYLIDEFQDTSILQWHNLKTMIQEALSTGGSLFYVGDKKQAIYRFRGGEAKLFDRVKAEFEPFNVKLASLHKNWRSQKAIVDFNNQVFSKDNLALFLGSSGIDDELAKDKQATVDILKVFGDASQQYRNDKLYGYVGIEHINEDNQQQRDEITKDKVLSLISELKKRFDCKDIAVLTRDNNEVKLVTSWCLEAGLAVESENTLNLVENYLIKELISFLRFLRSPIDDLSFAGFILGDIFSAISGIATCEITDFIFSLRKERKLNSINPLYCLFRKKYQKIWDKYFDSFFKIVGFTSPYELLVGIYQNFSIIDRFKNNQAFFMKFLELIKAKEDDYPGLNDLLLYLESASLDDLYVNIAKSDSIKVLTVHKSKGLEFPVVIIPFLRMDINPETGSKDTNSYVVSSSNSSLGLMRITKKHREHSPTLEKIYIQSYKDACIDELNKIYVALTRAQFELYIFIPKKSASSNNKIRFMIPSGLEEIGSKIKYLYKKKDVQPFLDIPPSKYKPKFKLFKDEISIADELENRQRMLEGNILHAMLSQVKNCFNIDKDKILARSLKFAQAKYPFVENFSIYMEKIEKLLGKDNFKEIFFISDAQVFCEKEVVDKFGNSRRIDRLIVGNKQVLVVDYKISKSRVQDHEKQILEYKDIISGIYPGHKVKGCLIYLEEMLMQKI